MTSPIESAQALHTAIELGRFGTALEDLFTKDVTFTEYPNLVKPSGRIGGAPGPVGIVAGRRPAAGIAEVRGAPRRPAREHRNPPGDLDGHRRRRCRPVPGRAAADGPHRPVHHRPRRTDLEHRHLRLLRAVLTNRYSVRWTAPVCSAAAATAASRAAAVSASVRVRSGARNRSAYASET